MATFTIRDEDNIDIVLGGSNLSAVLSTSHIVISVDGNKSLVLDIDLNPKTMSIPSEDALSAKTLKIEALAGEVISATKLVYMISDGVCGLADRSNITKKDVIGIALSASVIGGNVAILLFGRFADAFFNYPVNSSLYLDINGNITDIAPTTGYSVLIGKGLGTGAIFIDIERPIIL